MYLALIYVVGTAGGLYARRLRVPSGAMIGAMVSVLLLGVVTGGGLAYPAGLRVAVQICSGVVIGCGFSRESVRELRLILLPAVLLILVLLAFNIVFALLIHRFSDLSFITSLFASAPGGVTDLAMIAVDYGANSQQVALLQLFRFIFVVSFFPPFMKKRYLVGDKAPPAADDLAPRASTLTPQNLRRLAVVLASAAAVGLTFRALGVPGGAIIGAIAGAVCANVAVTKAVVPRNAKVVVQICCGCYIGSQVTRQTLFSLGDIALPMALIALEMFAMAFITAAVIRKFTGLDMVTCLFSSIPGGISEMGIMADDLGLDTSKIVVLHSCRIIAVVCVFPLLVRMLAG